MKLNDALVYGTLGVGAVAFVVFVAVLFIFVLMICWNFLAPTFNVPEIGFMQSAALFILCNILFKGSGAAAGLSSKDK